jgi:hypothetical protein
MTLTEKNGDGSRKVVGAHMQIIHDTVNFGSSKRRSIDIYPGDVIRQSLKSYHLAEVSIQLRI